ncbi:lipid A biosynthesis acyltransferase [Solidesulfovibrio carbinoliphilus subsp. oakridgensis]|uniref:Lipid A biosynthesis acyltransferase n=1 Tax=Solidesulfovibrio carbinoliphilus subsp. oakridgensis TaxID=694327 RepID=G7Q8A3_9BACT|nr:lysophospholipid acyltransferase family protein [Solidesulfovibrio carbinoliphilus]EHJ48117.1 lipid A biosynthesis acyltransferase [Solidesulfovibrio carbinoliphilus subsp. oakridgensis]
MPAVRDALVWAYWHPFRLLVRALPAGAARALARGLGRVLARVPHARLAGMAEAARLVPGVADDPAVRLGLARRALVEFCQTDLEVLLFPGLTPARTARLVAIRGRERLDAALALGRGAMLAFGHFGANQMIMAAIGHAGYRMWQLSAPATVLNARLPEKRRPAVARTRELRAAHERSLPVTHIDVFGSLRPAFACLRAGHVLGVAVDGGGGERRAAVPFLGRRALFSLGPMLLAGRTGCAVLPCFMERGTDGRLTLRIEEPLPLVSPAAGETEAGAATANTALFAARLSEAVVANPSHYLHFLAFRELMAAGGHEPFFERD